MIRSIVFNSFLKVIYEIPIFQQWVGLDKVKTYGGINISTGLLNHRGKKVIRVLLFHIFSLPHWSLLLQRIHHHLYFCKLLHYHLYKIICLLLLQWPANKNKWLSIPSQITYGNVNVVIFDELMHTMDVDILLYLWSEHKILLTIFQLINLSVFINSLSKHSKEIHKTKNELL